MAVSAKVQDGKLVETASEASLAKAKSSSNLDKDAFLQLLVAQMKYQDPLEPTSNSEFISQYATFSSLEQMQNMSNTLELSRASAMVGKVVNIQTTSATGHKDEIVGRVDYVVYERNKAYVCVEGNLYSLDDVYSVVDQDFQDAYDLAVLFVTQMSKLPSLINLSMDDFDTIEALQKIYNNMSLYQQSFVAEEVVEDLKKYIERMAEIVKADFSAAVDRLPAVEDLTDEDMKTIKGLVERYEKFTDEFKETISDETKEKYEAYAAALKALEEEE